MDMTRKQEHGPMSGKEVLSLGMSYRVYLSKVSYNRTGWPHLVAALLLQHKRSADRIGDGTIGGSILVMNSSCSSILLCEEAENPC